MLQPLLLTLLGAAGTGVGGLMVVLQPQMNFRRLGALQGLAAGLMLSISLIDLLPEAADEIGFIPANLCFYAGVLFFAAIVALIPDPDAMFAEHQQSHPQKQPPLAGAGSNTKQQSNQQQGAVASAPPAPPTPVPGSPAQHAQVQLPAQPAGPPAGAAAGADARMQSTMRRRSNTAAAISPAAARLDTSCAGYLPPAGQSAQQQQPALSPRSPASSCGGCSTDLQVVLNEETDGGSKGSSQEADRKHKRQLLMSGLITAVGIGLHNFPEGIAVLLAAQKSTAVGISLACAIALHNIPEGVAVALPVYFATGSRWRGLQTAVLSGLAEPLAVILLGLVLPFMQLNKHLVDGMLAGVGGIMAFLAFHELLPLSLQHAGKPLAVTCLFAGMGLMSITLHYLNTHVLADLH